LVHSWWTGKDQDIKKAPLREPAVKPTKFKWHWTKTWGKTNLPWLHHKLIWFVVFERTESTGCSYVVMIGSLHCVKRSACSPTSWVLHLCVDLDSGTYIDLYKWQKPDLQGKLAGWHWWYNWGHLHCFDCPRIARRKRNGCRFAEGLNLRNNFEYNMPLCAVLSLPNRPPPFLCWYTRPAGMVGRRSPLASRNPRGYSRRSGRF
jgi:hypothetical protein